MILCPTTGSATGYGGSTEPDRTDAIEAAFAAIPSTYIADGHHRAASAVKVGLKRRTKHPGYTGEEPFNYFLSVLFPDEELMILPYNPGGQGSERDEHGTVF